MRLLTSCLLTFCFALLSACAQLDIDSLNQPIFVTDSNGIISRTNRTFTRSINQRERKEQVFKGRVAELPGLTQASRDALEAAVRRAIGGQTVPSLEIAFSIGETSSGGGDLTAPSTSPALLVEWAVQLSTRRDATGMSIGAVGVCVDVSTTRHRDREASTERNLGSSGSAELNEIIEKANTPIFGIDKLGVVNQWNLKAASITGYSKEHMIGKHLVRDFITADYQSDVASVMQDALRGQETDNFVFPMFNKDGERFELLFNTTSLRKITSRPGSRPGSVGAGLSTLMEDSASVVGVLAIGQVRSYFYVERPRCCMIRPANLLPGAPLPSFFLPPTAVFPPVSLAHTVSCSHHVVLPGLFLHCDFSGHYGHRQSAARAPSDCK